MNASMHPCMDAWIHKKYYSIKPKGHKKHLLQVKDIQLKSIQATKMKMNRFPITPATSSASPSSNPYARPTSPIPHRESKQAQNIEKMLMKPNVKDRLALYETITKTNQTEAVAVIFRIDIVPHQVIHGSFVMNRSRSRSSSSSITGSGSGKVTPQMTSTLEPIDELKIIKHVREVLENDSSALFDDKFGLVKHDDHHIYAICTDPIIAMERMLKARTLIDDIFDTSASSPFTLNGTTLQDQNIKVYLSGGCELGNLFELTNDYFGDPVSIASTLVNDIAKPGYGNGQLLVSFNGKECDYIYDSKIKHKASFDLGTVEVSGGKIIEYYEMVEKVHVSLLSKLFCCPTTGSTSQQHSNSSGTSIGDDVDDSSTSSSKTIPNNNHKNTITDSHTHHQFNVRVPPGITKRTGTTGTIPLTDHIMEDVDVVILQLDLSEYARLTQTYGILHIMTIILNYREIVTTRHLNHYKGTLVKYGGTSSSGSTGTDSGGTGADGNNKDNNVVVCRFNKIVDASQYVMKVSEDIDLYNSDKEEDFQIPKVKIGLGRGLVLSCGDEDGGSGSGDFMQVSIVKDEISVIENFII
jgi:class 3 adenylate cyclase